MTQNHQKKKWSRYSGQNYKIPEPMELYLTRLSLTLISMLDQLQRICQAERILENFRTRVLNRSH